jgi:hypothetical protein
LENLNIADTIWVCTSKKKHIRRKESILLDLKDAKFGIIKRPLKDILCISY